MEQKNFDFHGVEISGFVSRAVKLESFNGKQKMKKNNIWLYDYQEGIMKMKTKKYNRKWKNSAPVNNEQTNLIQKIWGDFPRSLVGQPVNSTRNQPVQTVAVQVDHNSMHSLLR